MENMEVFEEEREADCTRAFVWGLLTGCCFWLGFGIAMVFFLQ